MNKKRARKLNNSPIKDGDIVYWMSREQRVNNNWAITFAQELCEEKRKLKVIFCLVPKFLDATLRQYSFMIEGLKEVEKKLGELNIEFELILGSPNVEIPKYLDKKKAGALVTDFDALKIKKEWKKSINDNIDIAFFEVDSHNIVPVWEASPKQEYGAYTLRPKINKLLPIYLDEYPVLKKQQTKYEKKEINWAIVYEQLEIDVTVKNIEWLKSGEDEALRVLETFIKNNLNKYSESRNNPNIDCQSNLSPYLHFGQISSQDVVLKVLNSNADKKSKDEFLEQIIIRKELTDNYCFYNENYDNIKGFPDWAMKSLNAHENDYRQYVYSLEEFEHSKTHDRLWNASQLQMVKSGKMHGYLRMYWAKKILEWSKTAEDAQRIAIYLNDKYSLDGRDPNGYVGINWSIGGLHDRPWFNRDVTGMIRYMSYNGLRKKFDVEKYIKNWEKE